MATTPHLGITLLEQSQAQKEITVNEALTRIDAVMNAGANDKDLAIPPGSPVAGDLYIIAASPTGAWSGKAKQVAYYDQVWRFIDPKEGMTLWVKDEDKHYCFDGTNWVVSGGGTVAVANGGTGATDAAGARTNLGLGTAAVANTGTSGSTVPVLNAANTWSANQTVNNANLTVEGSGALGIGINSLTAYRLRIGGNMTGSTTVMGVAMRGEVQSDATSNAYGFYSQPTTQAASFSLANLMHFNALQGTIGAGNTITNQFGFRAMNTITGAAENYAFRSDMNAGTSLSISNIQRSSNVVTVTTSSSHGLTTGQKVTVAAVTNTGINGTFVVSSAPTSTTFTYAQSGSNISSTADTGTVVQVGLWAFHANGTAPSLFNGPVCFSGAATTASAANAYLDNSASNLLLRSTSSQRYKTQIEDIDAEAVDAAMQLRPVWYRSLAEADRKDWSWYGLVAEEVAELEPRLVHFTQDEEGNVVPDGVQYERLTVLLLAELQRLRTRVAALEAGQA